MSEIVDIAEFRGSVLRWISGFDDILMEGAVDEFGGRGRSGGQKPGFFPEHFVTAHKNRKNPVSLVLMRPGLKIS